MDIYNVMIQKTSITSSPHGNRLQCNRNYYKIIFFMFYFYYNFSIISTSRSITQNALNIIVT